VRSRPRRRNWRSRPTDHPQRSYPLSELCTHTHTHNPPLARAVAIQRTFASWLLNTLYKRQFSTPPTTAHLQPQALSSPKPNKRTARYLIVSYILYLVYDSPLALITALGAWRVQNAFKGTVARCASRAVLRAQAQGRIADRGYRLASRVADLLKALRAPCGPTPRYKMLYYAGCRGSGRAQGRDQICAIKGARSRNFTPHSPLALTALGAFKGTGVRCASRAAI
jgi:hypothetical protein